MDTVFSVLIAAGCSAVSSGIILQGSSPVAVKDYASKPQRKQSSCRQTILIIKKIPRISFLSVLCKKSVNTYRQSDTDLFLIFKIILTPMSPKPVCVLGKSQHSLLLSTNRAIYHLQSLGRPLSFSNHFLIKTVILIFHS